MRPLVSTPCQFARTDPLPKPVSAWPMPPVSKLRVVPVNSKDDYRIKVMLDTEVMHIFEESAIVIN